ncbi:MAG: hypothetical protein IJT49_09650 [Clostridia bacterium]|nr:hypothetical protein [Clostridia bacterium]
MKKLISIAIVTVITVALALSANAATVANHLFDKQGGIDAGGQTWSVYGWIVTDTDITSVGYILDGGDVNSYKAVVTGIENDTRETADTKSGVSDAFRDLALEEAVKNGGMSAGVGWDVLRAYRIQIVLDISELEVGQHSILLCAEFLGGGFTEAFRNQSEFTFTKAESGKEVIGGKGASTQFLIDSDTSDETKIAATGWAGSTVETVKLGYRIDDGETVFNESHVKLVPLDVAEPGDAAVMDAAGIYAFRFKVNFPLNELPEGDHYIKLVMVDEAGGETVVGSSGGSEELIFRYEAEEVTAATETETETETEAVTETETEAVTETETEEAVKTEAETVTETEAEAVTDTETEAATEAGTEAQTEEAKTEPDEAEKDGKKGLPTGAIIAIIAAAVAVVCVIVVVIVKKKK